MTDAADLQTALMARFEFDAEDLARNRAGEYSDRQLAQFGRKRAILPVGTAIAVIAGLATGWIALTDRARRSADRRASQDLPRLPNDWSQGLIVFAFVAGFVMIWVLLLWWRLYWQQMRRGPTRTSGPVEFGMQKLKYASVPAMMYGTGMLGKRHVILKPEDEVLVSQIGQADVYWKQGTGKTDVLSIDVGAPTHRDISEP